MILRSQVGSIGSRLSLELNAVRHPPAHTRLRESPYPLVTVAEAIITILREIQPLPVYEEPVSNYSCVDCECGGRS